MQPFTVAAIRAVLTALLVGASTFLVTWSHTDDPKTLAIATATAVVSVLAARFGIEGAIDQASHNATHNPPVAAASSPEPPPAGTTATVLLPPFLPSGTTSATLSTAPPALVDASGQPVKSP